MDELSKSPSEMQESHQRRGSLFGDRLGGKPPAATSTSSSQPVPRRRASLLGLMTRRGSNVGQPPGPVATSASLLTDAAVSQLSARGPSLPADAASSSLVVGLPDVAKQQQYPDDDLFDRVSRVSMDELSSLPPEQPAIFMPSASLGRSESNGRDSPGAYRWEVDEEAWLAERDSSSDEDSLGDAELEMVVQKRAARNATWAPPKQQQPPGLRPVPLPAPKPTTAPRKEAEEETISMHINQLHRLSI